MVLHKINLNIFEEMKTKLHMFSYNSKSEYEYSNKFKLQILAATNVE